MLLLGQAGSMPGRSGSWGRPTGSPNRRESFIMVVHGNEPVWWTSAPAQTPASASPGSADSGFSADPNRLERHRLRHG